jgi:hypothetical protein
MNPARIRLTSASVSAIVPSLSVAGGTIARMARRKRFAARRRSAL